LQPDKIEAENARMTAEQLNELAESLSILSAKSSVLKERDELRALMEENLQAEEVCRSFLGVTCAPLTILLGSKIAFRSSNTTYPLNAN
jgi:LETM1 and EF-hand domain-containing protein 1, mitochondrial